MTDSISKKTRVNNYTTINDAAEYIDMLKVHGE